ncbi:MAG: ABC transporter substrate-binding protein, partial [Spirochaetes bacterium]|nr:ABC transporter substrate-binding protein [Spirochaetota bacterium]
ALAMAAEKDGIPVISPTASDPIVTLGRQNVFRAIFTDDYQVKVMAYFAYNSLNARTAVVLGNQNFANYLQAAKYFNESFTAFGGHIMAFELFSSKDDFKRILKKYVANPPDIIFSPDNFVSAARLVNAVYEIGLVNTYILGTDAWDGILTYVSNLRAMERVYYTAPFSFDDQSEEVSRFVRNFFNRFAQMPLTGSANAYISVHILADAITKAESTDWADIVSAIREKEFDTITGRIQFDENNNPYISVYIIQIKGGEYSSLKKISLRERQ